MSSNRSSCGETEALQDTDPPSDGDDLARGLRLVLRPDHGPGVGAGHLARCLALGQAWRDLGGSASLVSNAPLPAMWSLRYEAESVEVHRSTGWVAGDVLVLDGYSFGGVAQRDAPAGVLLVLDDLGHVVVERADVILDQNFGATERADWPTGAQKLLGPKFALLRRDITAAISSRPERHAADPDLVLVNAGGDPDGAWLEFLQRAVRRSVGEDVACVVVDGRQDMAGLLPRVSVAITASGSTIWELMAFGIPSLVVAFAENQRPMARALGGGRLAVDGGDYPSATEGEVAAAFRELLADGRLRDRLARRGRAAVDGNGASRVAHTLAAAAVRRRNAP